MGIKDSGEYDKFILSLFEKNLAIEGAFESEVQKFKLGADQKVENSDAESLRLRIVVNDDKVDQVMQALDERQLTAKSTDFKLSPLLKGKNEYQKWQQTSLSTKKNVNKVHLEDELEDDEETDEEVME